MNNSISNKLINQPSKIYIPDFNSDLTILGKLKIFLDKQFEAWIINFFQCLFFELNNNKNTDIYRSPSLTTTKGFGLEFSNLGCNPQASTIQRYILILTFCIYFANIFYDVFQNYSCPVVFLTPVFYVIKQFPSLIQKYLCKNPLQYHSS